MGERKQGIRTVAWREKDLKSDISTAFPFPYRPKAKKGNSRDSEAGR